MRRFLARAGLLLLPLALLAAVQLALPLDAFCFRSWEALQVGYRTYYLVGLGPLHMPAVTALPGPFLPSRRLARIEVGDLGHHTPYAVPRAVVWETDGWGYRASPSAAGPDLVLVGDSTVAGAGLSQPDTLAEVLRREHGIAAYPYAPEELQGYAADPRFLDRPPARVVVACIERNVLDAFARVAPPERRPRVVESALLRAADGAVNRLYEFPLLEWARARVDGRGAPLRAGGLLFLRGAEANAPPDPARVRAAAATLGVWSRRLAARGTRLALLVVPNKESTYADLFPGGVRSTLVAALREPLRVEGVDLIEVEDDFAAARAAGEAPFQVDDSHWAPLGVRLAARRIAAWAGEGDGRGLVAPAAAASPAPGAR